MSQNVKECSGTYRRPQRQTQSSTGDSNSNVYEAHAAVHLYAIPAHGPRVSAATASWAAPDVDPVDKDAVKLARAGAPAPPFHGALLETWRNVNGTTDLSHVVVPGPVHKTCGAQISNQAVAPAVWIGVLPGT